WLPCTPLFRRGVVHRQLAAVPFAHPDAAAAVAPYAARALPRCRRFDDGRLAGAAIDVRDEVAGQRSPPHVTRWRRRDAVGTEAARRLFRHHLARFHGDLAEPAALPGE